MDVSRRRLLAIVAAAGIAVGATAVIRDDPSPPLGRAVALALGRLALVDPLPRDSAAYDGQGAWVDAFDYSPDYQPAGEPPPVTPEAVDEMAAHGVRTLFLQAARSDARSPGALVDPGLLGQLLVRAHRNGMRVVGWYLPKFADLDRDMAHLGAIRDFSVLGHRFDGLAVDIEYVDDVPDPAARSLLLIDLSTRLRAMAGDDAVGAIVLPPVQLEVVNPAYWPSFPWREIASLYDVWLPMSYWTFRTPASGYHDGYTYNEESVRRLRADLGLPAAAVHPIGGIGDLATPTDLDRFVESLVAVGAVGGSVYDWNTLSADGRARLALSFGSGGAASALGQP